MKEAELLAQERQCLLDLQRYEPRLQRERVAAERARELVEELTRLGETVELQQDDEIPEDHFQWLNLHASLPLVKAKESFVNTGAVKTRLYDLERDDSFANRGRAIDYLVAKKRVDPSLKLPILLMLRTGMLD